MTKKKYRTDYLFSKPSFVIGAGSSMAIAGNYFSFNWYKSNSGADRKAIESDWGMVGQDIESGIEACVKNNKSKTLDNGSKTTL